MTLTGTLLDTPLEPGSPEWLRKMSASKIATVVGLTPTAWETPHSLWHKMNGTMPSKKQTDAQGRGHEFEPMIRRWFTEQQKFDHVEETSTWQHKDRAWQTADPDGLIYTDESLRTGTPIAGLEVKTSADLRDWGTPGTDEVPPYYRVQAQWQMDTVGYPRTYFAVCDAFALFERRPKVYIVDYDPQEAANLRAAAIEFLDSLEMGFAPDPDFRLQPDRDALRWGQLDVIETAGVDIPDEIALPYLEALAAEKARDTEKERARATLAAYLGDAKKATWQGVTLGNRIKSTPPNFTAAKGLADRAAELLAARQNRNVA